MRPVFELLSVLSTLLTIVFFFVFYKRNRQSKLWVIVLYTVCSILADFLKQYLKIEREKNLENLFLVDTGFTFVEGTIFGYFLYLFLNSVNNRRFAIGLYFLAIIIGIYTSFFLIRARVNSVFLVTEELSIILLCILYFYEQLNNPKVTFVYDSKQFWIILSFFFYTTSTLFLFLSTSILTSEQRNDFWIISLAGNFIKNLLIIIAFIKSPPGPTLGKSLRKV